MSEGLMGLEAPGFSGVIRFGPRPIQVQNGVFQLQGRRFFVSDKGEVTDDNDNDVARIRNGQLAPVATNDGSRNKEYEYGSGGGKRA